MSKYKLNDEFFFVTRNFTGDFKVEKSKVTRIVETESGFKYNDDMRDRFMYDDFEEARKAAIKRADEDHARNVANLRKDTEPKGNWL